MSGKFWFRTVSFLIIGYLCLGRSFAYLGIPAWHVFIAEIILALYLISGPATRLGRWPWVARRITKLGRLFTFFLILFAYGVFEVLRGISLGYSSLTAVRDLAFNYYPIFLVLGFWVGLKSPGLAPRLFRTLAWFNGVYGLAYILLLDRVTWTFPGVSNQVAPVPVFGTPEFSFVVLLGLLAYERDLRKIWHLLTLNCFVLLGMQVRAEWLGFAIGLLLLGWLTGRFKRILAGGFLVALLLVLMFVANFSLPGPELRGGAPISSRSLVGRAVAPFDADLAAQYTSFSQMDVDTTVWRTVWWLAIWNAVHQSRSLSLLGFGYGYPIGDLVPYLQGEFIQTPHNAFFYALGYTGWIGVALFVFFQAELAWLLWRAFRHTGQPAGIVLWVAMLAYAQFTAFFEAPYGAIPFFLLLGMILGAGIVLRRDTISPTTGLPVAA